MDTHMHEIKKYPVTNDADFERLFKDCYEGLYCYGLLLLEDEENVKDLLSDCFEYVYMNYATRTEVKDWKQYLGRMIKHRALDVLRHRKVEAKYVNEYINTHSEEDEYDYDVYEEKQSLLRKALEQLTPRSREVLTACYVDGKKYREVAEELGISESAVKKHMIKSLKLLRAYVEMHKDGDDGGLDMAILQFLLIGYAELNVLAFEGAPLDSLFVFNI